MCAEFQPIFKETECDCNCWVLTIGGVCVLLDCGWNGDPELLAKLTPLIPRIKVILLSQAGVRYVGALPFILKQPDFTGRVYATFPVHKMSQMAIYDNYASHVKNYFTVNEINAAWDKVKSLRYCERVYLKEAELVFTALRAGHSVGGSIWKIVHDMQEVIYAPCFNPHPMKHLPGLDFESMSNSAVFISDALHASETLHPFEAISSRIVETVKQEGSILIPLEAAGIILEIVLMLDQFWENEAEKLANCSLVLLSSVGSSVIEFAKSYLEWMSEEILNNFEGNRDNPFNLKFCKVVSSLEELPRPPCCIVATPGNIAGGLSRELFFKLSPHPNNLVLFLTPPSPFVKEILARPLGECLEIEDFMLVYEEDPSVIEEQEVRIFREDSETTVEEPPEVAEHFGSRLFDGTEIVRFAVFELKHLSDAYGENLQEHEMALWSEELAEKPTNDISVSAMNSYSQTVASKLQ